MKKSEKMRKLMSKLTQPKKAKKKTPKKKAEKKEGILTRIRKKKED